MKVWAPSWSGRQCPGVWSRCFDFRLAEKDLLQCLFRQAAIPNYQVRLNWRPNTIAFWGNRSTRQISELVLRAEPLIQR